MIECNRPGIHIDTLPSLQATIVYQPVPGFSWTASSTGTFPVRLILDNNRRLLSRKVDLHLVAQTYDTTYPQFHEPATPGQIYSPLVLIWHHCIALPKILFDVCSAYSPPQCRPSSPNLPPFVIMTSSLSRKKEAGYQYRPIKASGTLLTLTSTLDSVGR